MSNRRLGVTGVVVAGLLVGTAVAQVETPRTPQSSTPAAGAPTPSGKNGITPPQLQTPQTTIKIEPKLTSAQEDNLRQSEEKIFQFVSKDTGLAIKKPVKTVFVSRDEVNAELRKKFDEDKSNKRMQQSELVLKKFGLLDRDFHLRPFLLSLLTEQIAGFYDNKTKTMNLLNWVPIDDQKPVMAHELTHALQDQKLGLTKWEDPEPEGVAKNVTEDNQHIQTDEAGTAREAVLEGQAMVSFADYYLATHGFEGKTLKDVPQLGQQLESGAGDSSDSPVLDRAPLVLQQALLFPYTAGLAFEQELLVKKGTDRAFTGVLDAPPNSSFEIMNPDAYLAGTPVPVLHLPDIHAALEAAGWTPYDVGVMGELDVRMTTELFGGRPLAEALAPEWAGGVYYAAQKKDASAADKATTKSIGILYLSHWKDADSAKSFFHVFGEELPRQYDELNWRKADEQAEYERVYSTDEGDVLLTLKGSTVWVSEGFDLALARKLQDQIEAANPVGTGPAMLASRDERYEKREVKTVTGNGLLEGLGQWIGSFGVVKAAVVK